MPSLDGRSRQAGNRRLCPEEERVLHDVAGLPARHAPGQRLVPKPPQRRQPSRLSFVPGLAVMVLTQPSV